MSKKMKKTIIKIDTEWVKKDPNSMYNQLLKIPSFWEDDNGINETIYGGKYHLERDANTKIINNVEWWKK